MGFLPMATIAGGLVGGKVLSNALGVDKKDKPAAPALNPYAGMTPDQRVRRYGAASSAISSDPTAL